jgi:autotransporter strand-loop-strand O-heptosyltransferase
MIYENLKKNKNNIVQIKNKVIIHFVKGPCVEVKGPKEATYKINFIDNKTGKILYSSSIKNNMWTKSSIEYFVDWKIDIYENDVHFYTHYFNAEDKRIYVAIDSKALGDTLAWFPYIDEFRKKHKCKVIVSTFMNDMFVNGYPQLEFIEPGQVADNLYAMYCIGLFYNDDNTFNIFKNPKDPKEVTLQQMCSDILGLEYKEIKPKIKERYIAPNHDLKQVCIGMFGTAQSKFWNNPTGWQEVVDWLKERGYLVKLISKEGDDYMGNRFPNGIVHHPNGPIEFVMDELKKSKAFIGIGSGLSWLSWALNVPTVLISGFSYKWAEMEDCVRIGSPEGKCEGCFNRIRLDAGDWNWCPDHKNTDRQFECTKTITAESVIKELEKFL